MRNNNTEMSGGSAWNWGVVSKVVALSLIAYLSGCSGARPAKDELTKTIALLESVRKLGCAHDSLSLAEESYAKAQKLFDQKKYNEARAQASAARELAQEASDANEGKPCEAPPPPQDTTPVELPTDDDDSAVEPFEAVEAPDLQTVYFGFDSSKLSDGSISVIEENLSWIRDHREKRIIVEGHCDSRGTLEYNLALSDRRASSVVGYLKSAGIEPRRLEPVGLGSDQPASYRQDTEGYRLNRRVEFKVAR
jgi:peptidoglycan-associated lipoprotein